jgi:hypothetical protein
MEKEIAQNAKSNPKIFWKYANSKRKTNTGISELTFKSEEGEERKTTTDKEKAEVLASFFSSVFTIEPLGDLSLMHTIEVKQECIEKTFKESEILKLIESIFPPLSRILVHSSITFRSCRVVDFPEMKPNGLLLKSLLADMCFTIISLTSFSMVLQTTLVRQTGL